MNKLLNILNCVSYTNIMPPKSKINVKTSNKKIKKTEKKTEKKVVIDEDDR